MQEEITGSEVQDNPGYFIPRIARKMNFIPLSNICTLSSLLH
jgi:hypothetical protein